MLQLAQIDEAALVEWTRELVRFPSPQTNLFEQDPQIQAFLSGPVVNILDRCGLAWRRDRMGNVIVEIGRLDSSPSLQLMAYAMTHPGNRMINPFGGEVIDQGRRIRGRGVSEQKGALAAAIAAVFAAKTLPLKGHLVLSVSSAGETGRHDAAQAITDELGYLPDANVIVIGTTSRVALANKGRIDVEVTVKGKSSHSSTPWAGIDAITGARQVLDRVLALDVAGREHEGLGRASLTATSVRSWPEATHTVQDEVRLVFDRRLLPGDDRDIAFRAIAAAAEIGGPWTVETTLGPTMYPAELDRDGKLLVSILEGCASQSIAAPSTFYSNGALDAGLFHDAGKEAAMWGPGNIDLWHTDDESIGIDELVAGAKAYLGLIQSYLC